MSDRRRYVWQHNGLLGRVGMAKQGMRAIYSAPSTTPETKDLAMKIEAQLYELAKLLKTRVD